MNGLHNADELTSTSQCIYTMLRLLFDYVKQDDTTVQLLSDTTIIFIPIVNVEGWEAITRHFMKTKDLVKVNKNRNEYADQADCPPRDIGVDLNRNYAHKFALNDTEADPCDIHYAGPTPFSELETSAIRDFVDKWTNIKIAINFHAFGNLFVIPFNSEVSDNEILSANFTKAKQFYDHVHQHADFPAGNKMGNYAELMNKTANGEASDYFLAEKGIYSVSPRLGTNETQSETFFIDSAKDVEEICEQNYPWVYFMIKQLHPSINLQLLQLKKNHDLMREIDIQVSN